MTAHLPHPGTHVQLFFTFERRPIAAASLGQVHRAVLHTGEQVVIKVQRPGLRQLFDIDLKNLKRLAEQLDKGDENRDFKVHSWGLRFPSRQACGWGCRADTLWGKPWGQQWGWSPRPPFSSPRLHTPV